MTNPTKVCPREPTTEMQKAGATATYVGGDPIAHMWRAMYDAAPAEAAQGEVEAIRDIAAERERQKSVEGWTPQHDDDEHYNGELPLAAACYARHASGLYPATTPTMWPWDEDSWKPKDPRRDLVRAGALIVAEIERLDRALAPKAAQDEIVDAQHDETGRMWRGPRKDIPDRFAETAAQREVDNTGDYLPPASPSPAPDDEALTVSPERLRLAAHVIARGGCIPQHAALLEAAATRLAQLCAERDAICGTFAELLDALDSAQRADGTPDEQFSANRYMRALDAARAAIGKGE
jgi:hypothetical protein